MYFILMERVKTLNKTNSSVFDMCISTNTFFLHFNT